jgi:two-component system, chemotaxis family, protein-glutamate methylesterase/glutaminase
MEDPRILRQSRQGLDATGQTYSCPECAGVLEEMQEGEMVRFRGGVGHIYSPESLDADMHVAMEKALWAAIRTLEKHAEFSDRLASRSQRNRHALLASRF